MYLMARSTMQYQFYWMFMFVSWQISWVWIARKRAHHGQWNGQGECKQSRVAGTFHCFLLSRQVLPGLYVGNYRDSKDQQQLEKYKITHIIAIHDSPRRLIPVSNWAALPVQTANDSVLFLPGQTLSLHHGIGYTRSEFIAVFSRVQRFYTFRPVASGQCVDTLFGGYVAVGDGGSGLYHVCDAAFVEGGVESGSNWTVSGKSQPWISGATTGLWSVQIARSEYFRAAHHLSS